jgi:hypothetical protein
MNKKKLLSLLNPFIVSKNNINETESLITNITTNLQKAQLIDVVFYKVNPRDEKSVDSFQKRLIESTPGLLILNHGAEFVKNENCLFVEEEHFR